MEVDHILSIFFDFKYFSCYSVFYFKFPCIHHLAFFISFLKKKNKASSKQAIGHNQENTVFQLEHCPVKNTKYKHERVWANSNLLVFR